jgi:hypothetical protein
MQEYKNYMLTIQQGGDDKENPCPKTFTTEQWTDWKTKREQFTPQNKDTELYNQVRKEFVDKKRSPDRVQATSSEITEISNILKKKYPDLKFDEIKKTMEKANNDLESINKSKQNVFLAFLFSVVIFGGSTFGGNINPEVMQMAFIIVNCLIIFYRPLRGIYNMKSGVNGSEKIGNLVWTVTILISLFVCVFMGCFFVYGDQNTVTWLAYSGSEKFMQHQYDKYNMATVIEYMKPIEQQNIPVFARLNTAIDSLQKSKNYGIEEVKNLLYKFSQGSAISDSSDLYLLDGVEKRKVKTNKTRKVKKTHKTNKTRKTKKTKRNKKSRKTQKSYRGGILGIGNAISSLVDAQNQVISNLDSAATSKIQALQAVLVGFRGVLRQDILELVAKLSLTNDDDKGLLGQALLLPQQFLNELYKIPLINTSGIREDRNINAFVSVCNYLASMIPGTPKAFTFADSDIYYYGVSKLCTYAFNGGYMLSLPYITYFYAACMGLPDVLTLTCTYAPQTTASVGRVLNKLTFQDSIQTTDDLDCLREYFLMSFYTTLRNNAPQILNKVSESVDVSEERRQFLVELEEKNKEQEGPIAVIVNQEQLSIATAVAEKVIGDFNNRTSKRPVNVRIEGVGIDDTQPFESLAAAQKDLATKYDEIPKTLTFNNKPSITIQKKLKGSDTLHTIIITDRPN